MPMPGFLGQDIGGYRQMPNIAAPSATPIGPSMSPDLMGAGTSGTAPSLPGGTSPVTGVSYGDILKTAMQYGSKPGSSGPAIAGNMPGGVQPGVAGPDTAMLNPPQKQSSLGALAGLFAGWLGLGV
jgi:hypothetical protein